MITLIPKKSEAYLVDFLNQVKYFDSGFSTEKFSAFIKEVCSEYSELLYFSFKAISEIRDLEIIKNALNERYKRYHSLATHYEKELNEIKNKSTVQNNPDSYPLYKIDSFVQNNQIKEQLAVKLN